MKGGIRLIGLEDTASQEEVASVVAQCGCCEKEDVKVGSIRPMNNGLFTVWVQCPLSAAIKAVNYRRIDIGWTRVRVDLLGSRPTQCHKCWKFGHLRHACTSDVDYSKLCFRCGSGEHMARLCRLPSSCKICLSEGKAADHRLGSNLCSAESRPVRARSISAITQIARPSAARRTDDIEIVDGS